jgi:hypothetical protein
MIKFFRKIRYDLMEQNKTGKYLKYAIGEIVLVVIGILIALSINNWNTQNLDRISEADYLKRLSNDLVTDTLNFSSTVETTLVKQEALGNLLTLFKKDQLKTIDSINLLKTVFRGRFLSFAHPKVNSGTFEELKNTGRFKQIKSTLLRTAITNYYFRREHHYQRIEGKRLKPSYGDEIDKFIPGLKRIDNDISYRTDLVSHKEIINRINKPEFKKIVVSEFNLAIFMYEIQKRGLEDSKNLLNQIKDKIAK